MKAHKKKQFKNTSQFITVFVALALMIASILLVGPDNAVRRWVVYSMNGGVNERTNKERALEYIRNCQVDGIALDVQITDSGLDVSERSSPATVITTIHLKDDQLTKQERIDKEKGYSVGFRSFDGDFSAELIKVAEENQDRCGAVPFENRGAH